MTRKHFRALADALRSVRPGRLMRDATSPDELLYLRGAWGQWNVAVVEIARAVRQFNPSFDRDRFFSACGYDPLANSDR